MAQPIRQIAVGNFPATTNYFFASDFMMMRENSMLAMLFGFVPSFAKVKTQFYKALEIRMPLEFAKQGFVDKLWVEKSLNTNEPFIQSVLPILNDIQKTEAENYKCTISLPDPLTATNFYADFASIANTSIVGRKGSIEFVRVPDGMFVRGANAREGEKQPISIVFVEMDVHKLYAFLLAAKRLLEDLNTDIQVTY